MWISVIKLLCNIFNVALLCILVALHSLYIQSVSNWCIHSLKCYCPATKWDRNTIYVVLYSLNFFKPVHVQNIHFLPQYTLINDVKQSDILSGVLLMEYHWWHVQNSMSTGFLDTNLTRTLPASAISLSMEFLFLQHWPFYTSCTIQSTSNLSRILVIVTLVGGGVPNSTFQRHSA